MRIVHALVMTAAICMAGVVTSGRASAQGRGSRGGGGSDTKADTTVKLPGEPGGPWDPERPIAFMIEHRKEIPLADSQVSKLGLIANRLEAADRPAHLALDTLAAVPVGPIDWAHITPAGRDSVIARRRAVSQANATITTTLTVANANLATQGAGPYGQFAITSTGANSFATLRQNA